MAYKLRVTTWENENEHCEGGNTEEKDRYFGSLDEVVSRLCYPWLEGALAHAIYQKQSDGSWLLYYHSI